MQISSSTITYDITQVQLTLGRADPPDADGGGQNSPTPASAGQPSAAPQGPAPAPGDQFDTTTLGGLLAVQQQPPQPGGPPAGGPDGSHPHHHGHHGHGRHVHGAEQGGQGVIGQAPDASATPSEPPSA